MEVSSVSESRQVEAAHFVTKSPTLCDEESLTESRPVTYSQSCSKESRRIRWRNLGSKATYQSASSQPLSSDNSRFETCFITKNKLQEVTTAWQRWYPF